MNKNVLITGTSTGIGLHTAILFAQKGYQVYASMRNLGVAENPNPPLQTRTSDWSNAFCHLKTVGDPDGTKLVEEVKKRFL